MIVRWGIISAEMHEHLGYGIVKFSPLLLLLNPKVSIEVSESRTEPIHLARLISRRHFPWIVISFRLPSELQQDQLVVVMKSFGRVFSFTPNLNVREKNSGSIWLPKPWGATPITWTVSSDQLATQVELCRTASGTQSIWVEKSEIHKIAAAVEAQSPLKAQLLVDRLPTYRRDLFISPGEVWVIGNAPSVRLSDLNKIAASKSFVVALNRFYKSYPDHELREDLVVSADNLVIKQFGHEILTKSHGLPLFLSREREARSMNATKPVFYLNEGIREELLMSDNQKVSAFGSSLIAAIQIVLLLGFKRIKLYGVDLDFDSFTSQIQDGNEAKQHFIADYRSGLPWNQPQWDRMMPGFLAVALSAKVRGADIVNYTPGHKLKFFPKGRV